MTTFVTGATGFIGRHLVPLLRARHGTVRCLVRATSDRRLLEAAGVDLVEGDICQVEAVRAGLEGCDRVVHLANLYSLWEADPGVYRRINVDGTRVVLEAALEAGVDHFVHVSTVAVFGRPLRLPFTEESTPAATLPSEYARTKREGDRLARQMAARGLPLTVLYPAAVLGPGDPKTTGRYIADLLDRRLPMAMFASAELTGVHVRDVAAAIDRVLQRPGIAVGEEYIVGRQRLSLGELTRLVAELGGVRPPWPELPDALAMATAALLDATARVLRRPPLWGLSLEAARTLRAGVCADGSKIERDLGLIYTPLRLAVEEAVQAILASA